MAIINGTDNAETLNGGDEADIITGLGGNDTINAGLGDDTLYGGAGADSLVASTGADLAYGGDGNDQLIGFTGNDTLYGGDNDDFIQGGTGEADLLFGEAGNDTLRMSGNDTLYGGDGNDIFETNFEANNNDDLFVYGGAGVDTLDVSSEPSTKSMTVNINANGTSGTLNGLDTVVGDGADVTFEGVERIVTGGGSDNINGQTATGSLNLSTGGGDDSVITGVGNDVVDSGTGDDTIDATTGGDDTIYGGDGNDLIMIGDGNNLVYAGAGNDTVAGRAGNDIIYGGAGSDILYGGDGNDTIVMGSGDTIYGGAGNDVFTIDTSLSGNDTITIVGGTEAGTRDVLDLTGGPRAGTTATITYSNPEKTAGTATYTNSNNETVTINFSGMDSVICFARGTMIDTAAGEKPIESLEVGDLVRTADHDYQPIRWIGASKVQAIGNIAPILIKAGTLGNSRDLRVSPQHRMLLGGWQAEMLFGTDEVLVAAKHLVNDSTILRVEGGEVEYFHMLFDTHEIVFAEGAPSESFHPGQEGWGALAEEARAEILALFPELAAGDFSAYGTSARRTLKSHEAAAVANLTGL